MLKQTNSTDTDSNIFQMEETYDVALRPNDSGYLDDVVVKDVKCFRMERMDTNAWWLACYLKNGERIDWALFPTEDGIRIKTTDFPKKVKYEEGSLLEEKEF